MTAAALAKLAAAVRKRHPEIDQTPPLLIGEGISTLAYGLMLLCLSSCFFEALWLGCGGLVGDGWE